MAEQDKNDQDDKTDDLDGITDDDAKRLLEKPKKDATGKDDDEDPDGADQLGDAGRRALNSIKESRRAAREERDNAKAELAKVQAELRKHSDKDKSELQRLIDERDSLKTELSKTTSAMRRREAAEDHAPDHATPAQIRAVAKRLAGDTDEELAADAKELYALIAPEPPKSPVSGRPKERLRDEPKERLRGGGDPDDSDPGEMNPKKLAGLVPRAR
jgi:chromosome segregation ATPase